MYIYIYFFFSTKIQVKAVHFYHMVLKQLTPNYQRHFIRSNAFLIQIKKNHNLANNSSSYLFSIFNLRVTTNPPTKSKVLHPFLQRICSGDDGDCRAVDPSHAAGSGWTDLPVLDHYQGLPGRPHLYYVSTCHSMEQDY